MQLITVSVNDFPEGEPTREGLIELGWHQCGSCNKWWDQLPDEGPCPGCGGTLLNE
jgi:hypothetical protein